MSIYFDERHVRTWHGYSIYQMGEFTMRSGYCLTGLADPINLSSIFKSDELVRALISEAGTEAEVEVKTKTETVAERFYRRGESILEHSAKFAYLCALMDSNFPGFFNTLDPVYGSQLYKPNIGFNSQLAFVVALIHDITEVYISDIPNDGNPMHAIKGKIERKLLEEKIAPAFSREDYMLIRELYASLQKQDTPIGQALGCLDGFEAVLTLIWSELFDVYGLNTAKPKITKQDMHYIKLTGTPCSTDCWAAHMKDRIKDFPDAITRHVYGVLCAAVMEVRGEWFPWWDKI